MLHKNFAAIYAVATNGIIGKNNDLPWPKLKEDMKRFVKTTKQKDKSDNLPVMIMGRKTFESWGGKLLKGRLHILMTNDKDYFNKLDPSLQESDMLVILHSKEEVMSYLASIHNRNIFVVGGPAIWLLFQDEIQIIYKTEVEVAPIGDVSLPPLSMSAYTIQSTEFYKADADNPYNMRFVTLTKEVLFIENLIQKEVLKKESLYNYGIAALADSGISGPPVNLSDLPIKFLWNKRDRSIQVSLCDMQTVIDEASPHYHSIFRGMYTKEQQNLMDTSTVPVMETGETFGDAGELYEAECMQLANALKEKNLSPLDLIMYKN